MGEPSVRLVILGDSGVGKTRLCHVLSGSPLNSNPEWTIGCNMFVFAHIYKNKTYHIECLDIGGSSVYSISRNLFYQDVDGILLVHDLSNRNSFSNLGQWITECVGPDYRCNDIQTEHDIHLRSKERHKTMEITSPNGNRCIALVIGNKKDKINNFPSFPGPLGDNIYTSSLDGDTFKQATYEGDRIRTFLNQVIASRYDPMLRRSSNSSPNSSRITSTIGSLMGLVSSSPLRTSSDDSLV